VAEADPIVHRGRGTPAAAGNRRRQVLVAGRCHGGVLAVPLVGPGVSVDEVAVRFHHRLVLIRLLRNGNDRHARLAIDLLVADLGAEPRSDTAGTSWATT